MFFSAYEYFTYETILLWATYKKSAIIFQAICIDYINDNKWSEN